MSTTYIKRRFNEIVWQSDMLTTRVSLLIGAFFWGILLLWPGELFTPARTTYRLMAEIASEHTWGIVFLFHAVVSAYQLFERKLKEDLVLLNNTVGCLLWTSTTVACFASHFQSWETYQPPAAMSAELAMLFASLFLFIKTIVARQCNGR